MVLTRSLPLFVVSAVFVASIHSCVSFRNRNTAPDILPGGGSESALAKKLAAGKLRTAERPSGGGHGGTYRGPGDAVGGPRTGARGAPGPSAPGPASPGPSAPASAGAPSGRSSTGSDEFHLGATRRLVGDGSPKKRKRNAPQRWQQDASRPSFARVYVGDGNSLELVRMRVTVTIEGARARTVVDHVFRNPHNKQLEGTFEYPLPANASPSYYAMFLTGSQAKLPPLFPSVKGKALPSGGLVALTPKQIAGRVDQEAWGELREARVVHREKAQKAYEEITRRNIDPALLEYAAGNTFRGRVFPIQSRGLNRVLIAYEQDIDVVEGKMQYVLPLPDCKVERLDLRVGLRRDDVTADRAHPSRVRRRADGGDRIVYEATWRQKGPGDALIVTTTPRHATVQATTGVDPAGGGRSFHARLLPDVPVREAQPFADRAVFLLDTSFSEAPDRFRTNLAILRSILKRDSSIRKFNVMCFDVGAAWLEPEGWIDNDAKGRRRAYAALDEVVLEGATDLGAAIDLMKVTEFDRERVPAYVFLLTDGQLNWGERSVTTLARELEHCPTIRPRAFCYRTGLSAENLELFGRLTRGGGGIFNVFNESMARRVGLAHRRASFVIEDIGVENATDVLVAGRKAAVFAGGEVVLAGRFAGVPPKEVLLRGTLDGDRKTFRFPLQIAPNNKGELADRAWAEIAVQQLLALEDQSLEKLATAYAQRYRIGSRVTSFLVLEKDSDFEEFDIAKEGSALHVDDLPGFLDASYRKKPEKRSPKKAWAAFLVSRHDAIADGKAKDLLALLHDQDCTLPPHSECDELVRREPAMKKYLAARRKDRKRVTVFVKEAERRIDEGRLHASIRALSTVVESNPGRSDALRLVGYRMLSLDQAGAAAHLFDRVRLQRPYEPHSYRDLARALEVAYRYPLAALQYEILLAGKWHQRFGDSLRTVALDEYRRILADGLQSGTLSGELIQFFESRRAELAESTDTKPPAVRVTMTWNTDNTDIDLWVVEPGGEACGYSHKKTMNGGELLADLRSGYGPERYEIEKPLDGEFTVLVKHFRANPNLIGGETHVDVVVERFPGTVHAQVRRFQIALTQLKEAVEVCRVRFGERVVAKK